MIEKALFSIFDFFAKNKTAQAILVGVLVVISLGMYIHGREKRAVERARDRWEKDALREQARVEETRREIEEERTHVIEEAREAGRSLPDYSGPDELRRERPRIADELFGSGSGRSGEGA